MLLCIALDRQKYQHLYLRDLQVLGKICIILGHLSKLCVLYNVVSVYFRHCAVAVEVELLVAEYYRVHSRRL